MALFEANMERVDRLQAEQMKEARESNAPSMREKRGWTREELYEDRGFRR
jgi:hypothetical protein